MNKITVLLVEDHTIVREGLRRMIDTEPNLEVVGEATDGREAVAMAAKLQPDVILMDIAMPHMNGLEATRQMLKALPAARILILSAHSDDAYVAEAIKVGAKGFVLKQTSSQDVCHAIAQIHAGQTFFSPSVSKRLALLNPMNRNREGVMVAKACELSSRETEVLQLIAEGMANKQVASELSISAKTVEKHRASLMAKLDIHDTAGLTRYAISTGVIESRVQNTTS